MTRLPYLLGATALALAFTTVSCTTLGTHVKGGFACKAPQGTCAPMSNIDAQAIAGLGTGGPSSLPVSGDRADGQARFIDTGFEGGQLVRTGEHVLRVVFPAHTDQSGVFHEQAVAHVVDARSSWTLRPSQPPAPGSLDAAIAAGAVSGRRPVSSAAGTGQPTVDDTVSAAPLSLREAAAGLSAPAIAQPDEVAEQVATDIPVGGDNAPTAAALALARTGHRIGDGTAALNSPVTIRHGAPRSRRHRRPQVQVSATVAGAETAALNRAALGRIADDARSHDIANKAQPQSQNMSAAAGASAKALKQ